MSLPRSGPPAAHADRRLAYSRGGPDAPSLESRLRDLTRDVALHFVLPRTSMTPLLKTGALSAQEVRCWGRGGEKKGIVARHPCPPCCPYAGCLWIRSVEGGAEEGEGRIWAEG